MDGFSTTRSQIKEVKSFSSKKSLHLRFEICQTDGQKSQKNQGNDYVTEEGVLGENQWFSQNFWHSQGGRWLWMLVSWNHVDVSKVSKSESILNHDFFFRISWKAVDKGMDIPVPELGMFWLFSSSCSYLRALRFEPGIGPSSVWRITSCFRTRPHRQCAVHAGRRRLWGSCCDIISWYTLFLGWCAMDFVAGEVMHIYIYIVISSWVYMILYTFCI